MNKEAFITQAEGGLNRRDICELHPAELGEIIWQHNSGSSNEYIAARLRVKLWQVARHIDEVQRRMRSNGLITSGAPGSDEGAA